MLPKQRVNLPHPQVHPRFGECLPDDRRDPAAGALFVQVVARPYQCRQGGYADMVAEQQRRRPGAATAAVENDVVGAGLQGEFDVALDVVGAHFETCGDGRTPANLVWPDGESVPRLVLRQLLSVQVQRLHSCGLRVPHGRPGRR